jgi:hypothetical protein
MLIGVSDHIVPLISVSAERAHLHVGRKTNCREWVLKSCENGIHGNWQIAPQIPFADLMEA